VYPYIIYPALLSGLGWLFRRPVRRGEPDVRSVSFVVCAHNEEKGIQRRLVELADLLDTAALPGEVVVVSDGSSDGTAELVRAHAGPRVRLIELPRREGKAVALSRGVEAASGDVVVFADVRQVWAPDALERLLENFADPDVGAVSGDLVIASPPGTLRGVGLYWRFEKWLRRQESALGCQVGVTGAISAVRRELFRPIPPGTLLDDVYWPLQVALQGKRVIHDQRAVAHDRLPERASDEFRRKVRTLAGNFQLALLVPRALVPGLSPVWFQFLSRKLMRLVVPWALLGLLALAPFLPGRLCLTALIGQGIFYALALLSLATGRGGRVAAAAGSFLVLNGAAWVAFWVWASGRARSSWGLVRYTGPIAPAKATGGPGRTVAVS
jgi:cellulose synthase/poly-beta-1,6-N-acetylglucosamine synthase-like glycosyltransferase